MNQTPNAWAWDNLWCNPARFKYATTGRQVGKTDEAGRRIDMAMNAPPDPEDRSGQITPEVGVIGPKYEKAELSVFRYVETLARTFGADSYRLNQNKHELFITDPLAGIVGAKLKWLSAEDAFNVVGPTFSHVIIDEAQAIADDVIFKLRPTMDVKYAGMDVFGTPDVTKFQSWFQGGFQRGQDPLDADYYSFTIASWDAPWMSMDSILDAKRTLPENEFRRLYGGEWVADDGLLFTNVSTALLPDVPQYDPRRKYLMAVDLAVHDDFNVVFVGDPATKRAIFCDRWNLTDPLVSYDRIQAAWEQHGRPVVWADETGMGIPMVAELRKRGMKVHGVTWGQHSGQKATGKIESLQQLASDIQHGRIMFPGEWNDLRREMGSFVYGRSPSGKLTAAAAAGAHDDMVMALVLLNLGFHSRGGRSAENFQRNYMTSGGALDEWMFDA